MNPVSALARRQAAERGFTLLELVVSMSLAAMLMVALAESFQGFAKQLEDLRDGESELRVEEGLVQMIHDVRNAWTVEELGTNHLRVTDALGRNTEYWLDSQKDLRVKRASGAEGVLIPGLTSFSLGTKTIERLRPGTPADFAGKWFEQLDLPSADEVVIVEQDLPLALGLMASQNAPAAADKILGIDEHVLSVGVGQLALQASFAAPAEPASEEGAESESCDDADCPSCGSESSPGKSGESSGKSKWTTSSDEISSVCTATSTSSKKVDICHIPPGNPGNAHTISVSSNAQDAHLAHGDTLGGCSAGQSPASYPSPSDSEIVVELYEARAPNNAQPLGPALASVTIPVSGLPGGGFVWSAPTLDSAATGGDGKGKTKTVVCHYPPGNPANMHTISVGSANAVNAHLAHGDTLGSCQDADTSLDTPVLVYEVPTQLISIELSSMNTSLKPGRAHTLVLKVKGSGSLLVTADPIADAAYSGVAKVEALTSGFEPLPVSVTRSLSGGIECSQTTIYDVVSSVTLEAESTFGGLATRSAAVLGQVAIANPWLGAVPGELADLDLAGQ